MSIVRFTETQSSIPEHATRTPLDASEQIEFLVMLQRTRYQNMSLTEYADAIMAGSIQRTMSHDEFAQCFSATQQSVDEVLAFANDSNFTVIEVNTVTATVKLSATVADINRAFDITMYRVTLSDREYISHDSSLRVPESLLDNIDYILGLGSDNGGKVVHMLSYRPLNEPVPLAVTGLTPAQVAAAYRVPVYNSGANSAYGANIAILNYDGGYATSWITNTFSGIITPTITNVVVAGPGNNPGSGSGPDIEVMLDMFVSSGVAQEAGVTMYWSNAGSTLSGVVNIWNTMIMDTVNNPAAISSSWGTAELTVGNSASATINSTLAQAVTLGIPIFQASGDSGSIPFADYGTSPSIIFPSSSPYVISCGGTTLELTGTNILSEYTWNSGNTASGGGLSAYNSVPTYQSGLTYTPYNRTTGAGSATALPSRGTPDVSGNGDTNSGYRIVTSGIYRVGGTSAVAPFYAGVFTLLSVLLQSKLGNLNNTELHNFFYQNAANCFRDITSGNNLCTGIAGVNEGYAATTGWDACTGLGSPVVRFMIQLFKQQISANYPRRNYGPRPTTGPLYPRTQYTAISGRPVG